MSSASLEKEILQIIANQFQKEPESLSMQTKFVEDLKASPSNMVDLTMALEEKFNLQIPDTETEKMPTVGDLIRYVKANRN